MKYIIWLVIGINVATTVSVLADYGDYGDNSTLEWHSGKLYTRVWCYGGSSSGGGNVYGTNVFADTLAVNTTPTQLPSYASVIGVTLQNTTSTATVYVGSATSQPVILYYGDSYTIEYVSNTSTIYVKADTNAKISFMGVAE